MELPEDRTTRRCARCGLTLAMTEFHRDASKPGGRRYECRECARPPAARRRPVFVDPPGIKTCRRCETPRPISAFSKATRSKDGLQGTCRECQSELRCRDYRENLERERRKRAIYVERDPDFHRRRALRKRYGLSLEAFDELAAKQEGRCAICAVAPNHVLRVDHNHITGEVRGLVCASCNNALGMLMDDPAFVDRLIAYLKRCGHYGPTRR